ncbi:hypothetical protein [Bacillus sp. 3255]|uniref:hypothetical protein n=1 Tax=Bacillus sp. 3255 TaxID=2817904 RepID=UPI002862B7F7|nr:hypothetical protein [Bacillus sp. 3255]MDR6880803.1 hypothetical protein [Bacillus sp. 3255]
MCRYAIYGPYKGIFACFNCRKVFKQVSDLELSGTEIGNRQYKCPQCSDIMNDMGHDFKAPKQDDKKQWAKVELLYKSGFAYHSCGCNGPGYRPAKLSEVEEFVNRNKIFKSAGEALLQKLSVKN